MKNLHFCSPAMSIYCPSSTWSWRTLKNSVCGNKCNTHWRLDDWYPVFKWFGFTTWTLNILFPVFCEAGRVIPTRVQNVTRQYITSRQHVGKPNFPGIISTAVCNFLDCFLPCYQELALLEVFMDFWIFLTCGWLTKYTFWFDKHCTAQTSLLYRFWSTGLSSLSVKLCLMKQQQVCSFFFFHLYPGDSVLSRWLGFLMSISVSSSFLSLKLVSCNSSSLCPTHTNSGL